MTAVQKYFRTELSSYFRWSDHGRELCWCDGTTIAFHEEISAVLDRLVDSHFSDLSTIALALATLRGSFPDIAARLTNAVSFLKLSPLSVVRDAVDFRRDMLDCWPSTMRRLNLLTRYAAARSLTLESEAQLLSLVLQDRSSGFTPEMRESLATAFRSGLPQETVAPREMDEDMAALLLPKGIRLSRQAGTSPDVLGRAVLRILRLLRIAGSVAAGIPCDTMEELDLLLKTGIPDDVKATEELLPDQRSQTRALLNQMSKDDTLQGFARLTKQLIAAITLPRTLSAHDELQMGGVSDIANRGQLDQLLLSELANDELTLSVRIALNEALYLRRETPPSPKTQTRCVLIDMSLPLWGIPRLYATAAAMALHATTDRRIRIQCFRSGRRDVTESILTTREGLTTQLSVLEATQHPGESLKSFFGIVDNQPDQAEPVLITTSDVAACDEFRRALDAAYRGDLWLILVERDGRLTVHQRTRQGMSVRKQLQLALGDILSPATAEKVRRRDLPEQLPAVSCLQQFPLLLPHRTRMGRVWLWGETAISVSDDGRLMHWMEKGCGARQLAVGLPEVGHGRIFLVERNEMSFRLLACPNGCDTGTLMTIGCMGQPVSKVKADYRIPTVTDISLTESALLVFGKDKSGQNVCSAIGHISGPFFGTRVPGDDLLLRNGRTVLAGNQGFCVLNWVGGFSEWQLQRLPNPYQGQWRTTETSAGTYLSINQQGELVDPLAPGRFTALTHQLLAEGVRLHEFLEVSADGDIVVTDHQHQPGRTVVDLRRNATISLHDLASIEYERTFPKIRRQTLYDSFTGISCGRNRLLLSNCEGVTFQIVPDERQQSIRLERDVPLSGPVKFVEFAETPQVQGTGYTLKKAELPNGGRAWLDSRGLLHLKSGNRAHPEITLVLCPGPLSGWLSSGDVFGDDYYCGKGSSVSGLPRMTAYAAWSSAVRPLIESVS